MISRDELLAKEIKVRGWSDKQSLTQEAYAL